MMRAWATGAATVGLTVCALAACGSDPVTSKQRDAAVAGGHDATLADLTIDPLLDASAPTADLAIASGDVDGDGIDDALEAQIARDYLPYLNLDAKETCPLSGILYRVRPHPMNPAYLLILFDHLYQRDCGLGPHIGDDEAFGISVDPAKPAPTGIIAIRGISHQGTPCQVVSDCGVCTTNVCDQAMRNGKPYPVVWAAKDKHGNYARQAKCLATLCFDSCTAGTATDVPMQNAGEPGHHLTEDLTTNGFITVANGWTEASLMHFNPWEAGKKFGGAGVVADDLIDPAFETPVCP